MSAIPKKLGIVAGGGALPERLIAHCRAHGTETFTIGIDGHAVKGTADKTVRIGAAGSMISTFREHGVTELVIIGSVKRPKVSEMMPDLRTAAFFAKIGFRALGDDGLLKAVRAELENEGFIIHGIQDFMPELLMPKGVLTKVQPTEEQYEDIRIGIEGSRDIGRADVGQSVVVYGEDVIGTEDDGGTNALIERAACEGAILVKSSKPQQDRKLDMPTLGPETVRLCAALGYAGIAAEYGGVLLVDRDAMIALADETGLFVVGV